MAGYSGTPLLKKIGIKPGHQVAVIDGPKGFTKELGEIPDGVEFASADGKIGPGSLDVVVVFLSNRANMEKRLARLKTKIAQTGMIWTAWPKRSSGVKTDLDENVIRATALALGLVDIKVCAINEIWSGLKFVIPVKDRKV